MSGKFRYFVLLAGMRTGSNLFENNINLYQGLSCHGELFNPNFVGFLKKQSVVEMPLDQREKNPLLAIEELLAKVTDSMPGFRLFDDHDPRVLDYVLADESCAKIVLSRNPLDSFVSLQIAKQTDQWKMSDAYKRKKAQIAFSGEEFETYLSERKAFSDHIRTHLQLTGQTAFHLNYDDLMDVDVFNGLASHLGSEEVLVELQTKMVRQNPEPLSDKVENFDDMMEQVQNLNLFESPLVQHLEPKQHSSPKPFFAGTRSPLVGYAMGSDTKQGLIDWIQSHEPRADNVQTDMNERRLERWFAKRPDARFFVVLSDPLNRAHQAFENSVLSTQNPDLRRVRNNLIKNYGFTLPDLPKQMVTRELLESKGYGLENYKSDFSRFLEFLDANLKGQTRAPVHPSFASQSALLQSLSDWRMPDVIIRPPQVAAGLAFLENQLGLPEREYTESTEERCFPLSKFIADSHQEQIRALYQRDYEQFGL